jgi:hypothetical protein
LGRVARAAAGAIEFLKRQAITNLQETGECVGAAQVKSESLEALVEASDNVEDQSPIRDWFAEIM